jgi:CBS-domain-containing membrane protein
MAAFTRGIRLTDAIVGSAMSKTVHACRPDDSVSSAEQLMVQNQLHRLPVIDRTGRPIGVVSIVDLAKIAAEKPEDDGISCEDVTRTLREVCRPRTARPGEPLAPLQ